MFIGGNDAVTSGASVATGGKRLTDGIYSHGFFYSPTVLSNVNQEMEIAQKEVFDP